MASGVGSSSSGIHAARTRTNRSTKRVSTRRRGKQWAHAAVMCFRQHQHDPPISQTCVIISKRCPRLHHFHHPPCYLPPSLPAALTAQLFSTRWTACMGLVEQTCARGQISGW